MTSETIGIGITTRNRPRVLELCLQKFAEFMPECKFVVMDDNSNPSCEKVFDQSGIKGTYLYSKGQIGVARGKSECLKRLKDCDHIFLFDDDCFPIAEGWAEWIISEGKRTGQNHFIYNLHGAMNVMKVARTVQGLNCFQTGTGVMMYFTKAVIDKLGGYNRDYGLWGHEHNGYSMRVFNARLNTICPFMTPQGMEKYLFSLDMQGMPTWAHKVIQGRFKSAEPEYFKKYCAKEQRAVKARDYDFRNNYYQEL